MQAVNVIPKSSQEWSIHMNLFVFLATEWQKAIQIKLCGIDWKHPRIGHSSKARRGLDIVGVQEPLATDTPVLLGHYLGPASL